jgi:hypothetical protein
VMLRWRKIFEVMPLDQELLSFYLSTAVPQPPIPTCPAAGPALIKGLVPSKEQPILLYCCSRTVKHSF